MKEQKNIQIEQSEQETQLLSPHIRALSVAAVVLFVALLSLPTLVWGGLKLFAPTVIETLDVDTGENRSKAEFPEKFEANSFSSQVENWYNDNLPFRSFLYNLQSSGKRSLEGVYNENIYPWILSFSNNPYPLRYNNASQKVVYGREDWLFYALDDSLGYYRATNILSEEEMEDITQIFSQLQAVCDSRGIELRIMFIPNKEQIYSEYMPNLVIEDENKRLDRLVEYIRQNSDVEVVYPKQELLDAKSAAQLYYKYDTHWTSAGAYVGVQALYDSLGIESVLWHDITKTQVTRSVGDLLGMGDIDASKYTQDIDYFVNYRPSVSVNSTPGIVLGADATSFTLHTQSSSERNENLVFIGDSFRGAMTQYLQADFANTTITHRDYFEATDVKEEVLNADVLVLCSVERYDKFLVENAKEILELLQER